MKSLCDCFVAFAQPADDLELLSNLASDGAENESFEELFQKLAAMKGQKLFVCTVNFQQSIRNNIHKKYFYLELFLFLFLERASSLPAEERKDYAERVSCFHYTCVSGIFYTEHLSIC